MITAILLIIGAIIAGIPVGIAAIVNSAKVKGKVMAITLPLSIVALLLTLICLFGSISNENIIVFASLYLGGLTISIVTLSVSVHYRRKANNKIFDDKKKEHDESVLRTNNQITYYEEIKSLKELLDSGAITQEEYDNKKNEILNRK